MLGSGCGSVSGSKAGGEGEPVVLRIGNTGSNLQYVPAVELFAKRVGELSSGRLRVAPANLWGDFDPGAEQQVVRDVAAGKLELGWAGTRVFDTLGVPELTALTAPLLIDGYPVQQAVFRSGLPQRMLPGLDRLGLAGLAVLAGGMRKPISAREPLLGPSGWRGSAFQAQRSDAAAATVRAFGARPAEAFGPPLRAALQNRQIDGFEKDLRTYRHDPMAQLAPYITLNVNLWPMTSAVFAGTKTFAGLTERQRGWLRAAAQDAAARSPELDLIDQQWVDEACASGSRVANAAPADLQALRRAVEPVITRLEHDPAFAGHLEQIRQIKKSTPPGPELKIPSGCTGPAPK